MLAEPATLDDGPAGEPTALVRLTNAIQGSERFIGLIGVGGDDIIDAAIAALTPAVGFIHMKNLPASPLTLKRILSELGEKPAVSPEIDLMPKTDVLSVDHSLARCADVSRRIVLVLDQAQHLSTDTLLFLQSLPHSTARGTPVLKILFVADARFWALIGSDLFNGIRERSAEPVILEPRSDRKSHICVNPGLIVAEAPVTSDVASDADLAGDGMSHAATSRLWRVGTWAGLTGIVMLIGIIARYSLPGTVIDTVPAPTGRDGPIPIEVSPLAIPQSTPPEPIAAPVTADPAGTEAGQQEELRRSFNEFLSSRSLTHLSAAQRDRLFRQYLASRGQNPTPRP